MADPFYAYCKQHVDKSVMKYKRRNWLAVQSHMKQMTGEKVLEGLTDKEKVDMSFKLVEIFWLMR